MREQPQPTDGPTLGFYGGLAGALLPFVVFIGGVATLALAGAPDERGFWPILLLALTVSLLLARDRREWSEVAIAGMSQPLVVLMIMAWLLAGVLAETMNASGFVAALAQLAQDGGLRGGGFTVACFLLAAAVSTSTGTSLGTLILTVPLLYPASAGLGVDPLILLGALIGGATFGDNISPVSDTTIASATTQGAEMGQVVRSRLRYAIPAALVAAIVFGLLGGSDAATTAPEVATEVPRRALLMLLAPAAVIVLLLRRSHLVAALLLGNLVALLLGLALGLFGPSDLLWIDRENFVARGLVADGLERGIGISVFTLLLMGLISTLTATGILDRLVDAARGRAKTVRSAESWIVAVCSGVVLLTTHAVVTLLAVGPFAAEVGRSFGLGRARRANLLDLTVSTWPFLLPWFIPTILASSLSAAGVDAGLPRLGALEVGLANAHSWALLVMLIVAVASGYGRGSDDPEGAASASSTGAPD
jgi:Na+/H+ antiporter NhaC